MLTSSCDGPIIPILHTLRHVAGTFFPILFFTFLIEFYFLADSLSLTRGRAFWVACNSTVIGLVWLFLVFVGLLQIECSMKLGRMMTPEALYASVFLVSILPKWIAVQFKWGVPFKSAIKASTPTHLFLFLAAYFSRT